MVKPPSLNRSQLKASHSCQAKADATLGSRGIVSAVRTLTKVALCAAVLLLPVTWAATLLPQPAAIIVVGTTHQETADFSSTRLQQMLAEIKPDVILYEVDSTFFDAQGLLLALTGKARKVKRCGSIM